MIMYRDRGEEKEQNYIKIFSKEGDEFEVPLRLLKFSTMLMSIVGMKEDGTVEPSGIESQFIYKK